MKFNSLQLILSLHIRFSLTFLTFLFCSTNTFSQKNIWEDSFKGGVTTGGYSPEYQSGGTGNFTVKIEKGSKIRKAFFMAGRFGDAKEVTVKLNNKDYKFDQNNKATEKFESRTYGGPSAVHVLDITKDIDANTTEYTVVVPTQSGPSNRFNDFYLFIAYENESLPVVNSAIFLRDQDLLTYEKYTYKLKIPVNTESDFAISLYCGYICHMEGDGEFVYLNEGKIGQLGGSDKNSGYCGGPIGSFNYQNNKLTALSDDNADLFVNGSDALINAKSVLKNKAKEFTMEFKADNSKFGNHETNAIWAVILAYGNGKCDFKDTSLSADITICDGQSTTLKATGGQTYKWSDNSETAQITVKPEKTTVYTVTISSGSCSVTDSVKVSVFSNPIANPGSDTSICQGSAVKLVAKGGTSYKWSNGEKSASFIVKPNKTITYVVTVTAGKCIAKDSVKVTVNYNPSISAGSDVNLKLDTSVVINISGPDNGVYSWVPSESLSCSNCKNPVANPDSTTTYIVSFTNENNCVARDSITIYKNVIRAYYITNPFTPNNDGINDLFFVSLKKGKLLSFSIYNSEGKLVFKSSKEIYEWDGKSKNKDCPTGTYAYYIDYTDSNGKKISKTGFFKLSR